MKISSLKMLLISLFIISIIGCGSSKPSRYYLLTPQPEITQAQSDTKNIKIGLGPVLFPEYLKRPKVISYSGMNQLHLAEYERWAESLDGNFSRVLAENLTQLIPTDQVYIYPYVGNISLDYRIILEVRQFEMNSQSAVKLIALWQIVREEDKESLITKRSEFLENVNAGKYESIVAGMSKVTADLSREITGVLNSLIND